MISLFKICIFLAIKIFSCVLDYIFIEKGEKPKKIPARYARRQILPPPLSFRSVDAPDYLRLSVNLETVFFYEL